MHSEWSCLVGVCQTAVSWYLKLLVAVVVIDVLVSLISNPKLRYYCCYFCYVLTAMVVSVAYMPVLLLRFHDPTNAQLGITPAMLVSKVLGVTWEVRGTKYLDKDEAAVVTMSHQSMFDAMGLMALTPFLQRVWAVARKEVFYFWPFGLTIWFAGVIFIDRKNGRKANIRLSNAMEKVKKHKIKLIMCPEGTRNRQGKTLLPFKKGAFRLAIESQIPIVPVVFSPYYFINSEKKTFYRGKIIMSTLPPISTKGKTMSDLDMLLEKTQAIMEEEYQKLKAEIELEYGPFKT